MTSRLFLGVCMAVVLTAAAAVPVEAKTCLVKKLRYTNQGGYKVADLTVHAPGGYEDNRGVILTENQSRTLPLENSTGLAAGTEVWLSFDVLQLMTEDRQDCRKNGTKLVYDPGKGNTWSYYSGGTTENRNRCRFGKGNTCIAPQ